MILLLGAGSYVGQAFARALRRRKGCFIPLSREALDYTRFEVLFDYVRKIQPELVINAEGYFEPLDGASAEFDRAGMLQANTLLPQTVARVCAMTHTELGHVSSGSIYTGAKIIVKGALRIEPDLSQPALLDLFKRDPQGLLGFSETDTPNASFHSHPCTFASGTKALAEEVIRDQPNCFVWRLRLPFNERDDPDNVLSRLQASSDLPDTIHSASHLDDCVTACIELWERRAAFGTYNVVNPGAITHRQVSELVQRFRKPAPGWENVICSSSTGAPMLQRGCLLDTAKLRHAGVSLRPLQQAIIDALENWQEPARPPAPSSPKLRVLASP